MIMNGNLDFSRNGSGLL